MFFLKSDIKKKKPPAGKLATEVRAGDAPKPTFSTKTYEKLKKSGNQPPVNHRNFSLFLSLQRGNGDGEKSTIAWPINIPLICFQACPVVKCQGLSGSKQPVE